MSLPLFTPLTTSSYENLTDDDMCILLGCNYPIILRQAQTEMNYEVTGACLYVHGIMDSEVLIGTHKEGVSFQGRLDSRGFELAGYFDAATQQWLGAEDDPRLGPRPDDWVLLPSSDSAPREATKYQEWRNKTTGVTLTSDLRLTPDALKARGVKLETFHIM
jgi:hypothetical protein